MNLGAQEGKDTLHVALIGAGSQGERLMSACLKMEENSGIRFQAVCDIWEKLTLRRVSNILTKYGHTHTGYVDYQEMLAQEKGLDAVIIATPDFCHAEQTVACLKAGLHVYCESPMSNTLEGARAMVQAAQQSGKLLQIAHQRRSNPLYLHCWENLVQKASILGRISAANAQWNNSKRDPRGWSRRRVIPEDLLSKYGYTSMEDFRNWMWYDKLGSGPLAYYGTGQLDVLNWFLQATPKTITARGGTRYYDTETHQTPDTVMAVVEYETAQGLVTASYQTVNSNGYGGRMEVFLGDQGSMGMSEAKVSVFRDPEADDWEKWVRLDFLHRPEAETSDDSEAAVEVSASKPPIGYELPVKMEETPNVPHLRNFFAAVRGQGTLRCPAASAYAATATVAKINEALAAGKTLELGAADFAV
jgi:predicted dehydrogenase